MIGFRRRRDEAVAKAKRERLQIVLAAGMRDGEARRMTEHRLLFVRDLVERGRIGEEVADDDR